MKQLRGYPRRNVHERVSILRKVVRVPSVKVERSGISILDWAVSKMCEKDLKVQASISINIVKSVKLSEIG